MIRSQDILFLNKMQMNHDFFVLSMRFFKSCPFGCVANGF